MRDSSEETAAPAVALTFEDYRPTRHRIPRDAFWCAEPHHRTAIPRVGRKHAAPWVYQVQQYLKTWKQAPRTRMIVAMSGGDVAAMCAWEVNETDASLILLTAIATAEGFRRRNVGRRIMRFSLRKIVEDAKRRGEDEVTVEARIHEANLASKSLFTQQGFEHLDMLDDDPEWSAHAPTHMERWYLDLFPDDLLD